jgi:hypothetical protein
MRLFDATSTYVYIFGAYALNSLFLLVHLRSPASLHGPPSLVVLLPKAVGMICGVAITFASMRKTTSFIERIVLVLTGLLCVFVLVGVLPELGYRWAAFPFSRMLFVVISCLATVLVGIRVLQVVLLSGPRSALR